ncbi:TetR family transcriptional regulator [Mycobacteroides abscessus]|nr:TetR family transcriptional regulator [Mycobacteroides abscessus]
MELVARSSEARAPSARQLTRALGITAPSLYRHFCSMNELMDAMSSTYFQQLGEAMRRATYATPAAAERLHAMGMAYVRFAARSPLMYQFATTGPQHPAGESHKFVSSTAFLHLRDVVQELVDQEQFPPGDALGTALQIWATTHGVTSLLVLSPNLPRGEQQESFTSRTLYAVYRGMQRCAAEQARQELPTTHERGKTRSIGR